MLVKVSTSCKSKIDNRKLIFHALEKDNDFSNYLGRGKTVKDKCDYYRSPILSLNIYFI